MLQRYRYILSLSGLLFALFLNADSCIAQQSVADTLNVKVIDLKHCNGKLWIAVYSDSSSFMTDEVCTALCLDIHRVGEQLVQIPLNHGEYGITLFHDENGNGALDKNFFKFPKEAYGFSNDAPTPFGPPTFEEAKFQFDESNSEISIHLR